MEKKGSGHSRFCSVAFTPLIFLYVQSELSYDRFKDFVKLVLLANLLAWPVRWYAMRNWLQNFAYRVDIDWWVFVLAGGLAFVIALRTVSAQAIRAALANPVEALRYE